MNSLNEIIQEFCDYEKLHSNEGSAGVKNLCRIVNGMGYSGERHFGQFAHNGSYGDLINFLEDNSGCVEATKE